MKLYKYRFLIVIMFFVSMTSCESLLEVEPETALEPQQFYRDRFDADAAVTGVYGKFMTLAERYVVLNELRADLMDVTANADAHLRELNEHNVSAGNPYADVRPFYELIFYCNDVLKNFDIMREKSKFTEVEYNERYSDIGALRSWVYFQLALHFGEVPYITEPVSTIGEIDNLATQPKISLTEMVDNLIMYMESLPSKDLYAVNSTLRATTDSYNRWTMFINKKFFLGDLYLWKGRYEDAAKMYKDVMVTPVPGVDPFFSYKVKFADVAGLNDLNIGYIRYKWQDLGSLVDNNTQGWKSMFIDAPTDRFNQEWIWVLPFDSNFKQGSPFVDLFSNSGGRYLVKPSQVAINTWNSQTQQNGFPWDQRGRFTYGDEGGQPVIKKFIYKYNPVTNALVKNGKWFLNRAALLHLRYAEAAVRAEKYKLSWAMLNPGGIRTWFDDPKLPDSAMRRDRCTFLPYPYDFEARNSDPPVAARYRDLWHQHDGIRGRAYVTTLLLDSVKYFNMTSKDVTNAEGLKRDIEDKLITEAALELAYEGNRWQDLMRIAMRRNDPAYLANKVADKLAAAGNPNAENVRSKLMDMNNWFLPFPEQ